MHQSNRRSATTVPLILAIALNLAGPASFAQLAPNRPTFNVPAVPVIQQVAPTQAIQPTPTVAPTLNPTPITTTTPTTRTSDQQITIPSVFSNVILPTDTLSRSTQLRNAPPLSTDVNGSQRSYEFKDVTAFLRSQGWRGEIASEDRAELDTTNAITEDTDFSEPTGGIVPISYGYSDNYNAFRLCSTSDRDQPVVIHVNQTSKHLWVFTGTNQFLPGKMLGCPDALMSGMPGTVVTSHDSIATLHKGTLVVDAGSKLVKVATKAAGLKLPAESTSMIEYQPDNRVSIKLLACAKEEKAKIRLAADPTKLYELAAGQEISVDLSHTTASSADSVFHTTFPLSGFAQSLPKVTSGLNIQRYKKLCDHVCKAAAAPLDGYMSNKSMSVTNPVSLFSSEGTRLIASDNGRIALLSGQTLIRTSAPQIVRTQMGDLYMQKDAIVSVQRWQGELRAQCCSGPKSAIMVSDKCGIPMNWGIEGLVIDHEPTWADAFPNDGVGRRCFELHKLKTNNCIIAEYSLPALIITGTHLKALRKDTQEGSKQLSEYLIKTAAALEVVTAYHGQYATKPPSLANAGRTN